MFGLLLISSLLSSSRFRPLSFRLPPQLEMASNLYEDSLEMVSFLFENLEMVSIFFMRIHWKWRLFSLKRSECL